MLPASETGNEVNGSFDMANHNDSNKTALNITFLNLGGGDGYFEPKPHRCSVDCFADEKEIAKRKKRGCECIFDCDEAPPCDC